MTEVPVPSDTVGDISALQRSSFKRSAMAGLLVSMVIVLSPTASSWATPQHVPAQPELSASCSYRLDPPRRTDLPFGVAAVATILTPIGCQGEAQPVDAVACIQADGIDTQCKTGSAWNPAELNFRPWRPGVTYTATGTGCFLVGKPISRVCTPLGPLSAGL